MSQAGPARPGVGLGDMLRTVLVLLVPIVAFVGFQAWARTGPDPIAPVDYASVAASVREQAPFDVLAPEALPSGWRATSVRYSPGPQAHWHLGVLTADQDYLGLEQVVGDAADAIGSYAQDSSAAGTVTIAARQWQLRTGPDDEIAVVRQVGDVTTVVVATAPQDVLVSYVASLRS